MAKFTTLSGGSGDDVYYVDASTQKVVEYIDGGYDEVITSVHFDAGLQEIEVLKGVPKSMGLHLTGNQYTQEIWGTAGHDTLSDGGYADAETTMIGGDGNDTYFISSYGDVVVEQAGALAGFDTIKTDLGIYGLADNVEVLRYTGTGSFVGYGNDLNNAIYGGCGDDILDGGFGNDLLFGGAGDDVYMVGELADYVFEEADGGFDTMITWISTAKASPNVELMLYVGEGAFKGFAADSGTAVYGGVSDDTLIGGAGDDALVGGAGANLLTGGGGSDTFVFNSEWSQNNRITDFQHGVDRLYLEPDVFGVSQLGASPDSAMIEYVNGSLFYDPTGSADSSDRILLVTFDNKPTLTNGDFLFPV